MWLKFFPAQKGWLNMGIPLAQRRKMRLTVYHLWEATVSNRPAQQLTSSQGDLDQFSQQIIRNTTLGETLREETLIFSCYHLRISTLASGYSLSRSLIHSQRSLTHSIVSLPFSYAPRLKILNVEFSTMLVLQALHSKTQTFISLLQPHSQCCLSVI